MKDGELGLKMWLTGSANDFFKGFSAREKEDAISKIDEEVREELFNNGAWYIVYKRLRIMAIKPHDYGSAKLYL